MADLTRPNAALQHPLPRPLPRNSNSNSGSSLSASSSSSESGSGASASNVVLDPSGSAAIFLSAGEQVTVMPDAIVSPHRANLSATTAWTRGQLEFEETPLSKVAEEFGRLSNRTLVIEGMQSSQGFQDLGRLFICGSRFADPFLA